MKISQAKVSIFDSIGHLGKISVVTEKVLPNKEACQSLYKNYIFNSMMPIHSKTIGYAKDGLDKDADWAFLPGVANKGNDNNLGHTGNPQRPIIEGG